MSEEEKKGTEIISWQDQLAAAANEAVEHEKPIGGAFLGVEDNGLTWQGESLPGGKGVFIVLDDVYENIYYKKAWVPGEFSTPSCYALGRDYDALQPHENVFEAGTEENDTCDGCPQNEFGTARLGKGKACSNKRRLALIPAGSYDKKGELTLIEDADELKASDIIYLRVSVTSVKEFAKYKNKVKSQHNRPLFGVVTTIGVTSKIFNFTTVAPITDELIPLMFERHEEAKEAIEFPYSPFKEAAEEEAPSEKAVARSKKF